MSTTELESKCRELRQLQALIAEAEEEAESIKDAIKAFMGDSEAMRAGEYTVTWKPVKSTRMDTAALRAAFPEVAARFTRTTTTRRFCVA
jgi:hypothetical protein